MRRTLPWPLLLASLLPVALHATAEAKGSGSPSLSITLSAPDRITEGDRAALRVGVRLTPQNDLPMLVTPSSEGTAIEVVRGRLLRTDADDAGNGVLQFRVPVVARSTGTAIVRVRVVAYACDTLCREVRGERALTLRVHPGPTGAMLPTVFVPRSALPAP
jgi:hypothetical protein